MIKFTLSDLTLYVEGDTILAKRKNPYATTWIIHLKINGELEQREYVQAWGGDLDIDALLNGLAVCYSKHLRVELLAYCRKP